MMKNDQSDQQLTPKQDQLIELLLAGINVAAAAKQLNIGDKTARRWLKLDYFQIAYKAAQRVLFDQALSGLMTRVDRAIEALDRNMNGDEVPPSTQVRAAQIILEQSIAIYKLSEIEQKLAEYEEILKQLAEGKK